MHPLSFSRASSKGSALLTVVVLSVAMMLLTASLLSYSLSERRGNERNRLILRAKSMAENNALYASEQISTKLYQTRSLKKMKFSGTGYNIALPPDNVLTTKYSQPADSDVYAGITATTELAKVTDPGSPNFGLQASIGTVPIIAKSTMTQPTVGTVNAYAEQILQIAFVPLFQYVVFYNMDLEISPGADMTFEGPVHANGKLIARSQSGFSNTIQFNDRVTCLGGFFADTAHKAFIYNELDTPDKGPGGSGALIFKSTAGTTSIFDSGTSVWRDHAYAKDPVGSAPKAVESETSKGKFKSFADSSTYFAGNLKTSAHGVAKQELPGVKGTDLNTGRTTVEPALATDSPTLQDTKFSRKAGLYIVVNPDDEMRSGILPDASTVTMFARSYRCWLNSVDAAGNHVMKEVILPGQPTYGYDDGGTPGTTAALIADDKMYVNNFPNRYTPDTSVGRNQVLRTAKFGNTSSTGINYQLAAGAAAAATGLTLKTGTGTILAGDTIIIGANKYLVTTDLNAANQITIADPGLKVLAAVNVAVTVEPLSKTLGTGTGYKINGNHAAGLSPLVINTGAGTILPGNILTIGAYKYLVVSVPIAAPPLTSVIIASPGLQAAAPAGTIITIDSQSNNFGTGSGYLINNGAGYPATTNVLKVDTGTGTILPGNSIVINSTKYLVASSDTASPHTRVVLANPGLTAAVADNALLVVDSDTGYAIKTPTLTNASTVMPSAYFYDLRRATNSTGHSFSRPSGTFIPRPIVKIDFDMARFKMCVSRTLSATTATLLADITSTTGYNVDIPNGTNWANNILNADAATAALGHGLGAAFNTLPTAVNPARQDPFRMYFAPANPKAAATIAAVAATPSDFGVGSSDLTTPWYDGVTVYIHSVAAETLTESTPGVRDRIDSGVRLWNGRGLVVSLTDTNKTGFSFGTNDAAYIIGHFNADGKITTGETNLGGRSDRYRDVEAEKLTSVRCDALTIYSQPIFTVNGGGNYYQNSGWSDSLSGNRCRTSGWSASWATTNPDTGNRVDGVDTNIVVGSMPNYGTDSPNSAGDDQDTKFNPSVTEISTCMLTGIVESTDKQHSGGVHNYPRLNENWSGTGLYIRGAMVAMFASKVEIEPWSIRIYSGAGRFWGLHQSLRDANHDVPLEPILINAQRLSYAELTPAQYAAQKTIITGLTAP